METAGHRTPGGTGSHHALEGTRAGLEIDSDELFRRTRRRSRLLRGLGFGAVFTSFFVILGLGLEMGDDLPFVLGVPLIPVLFFAFAVIYGIAYAPAWISRHRMRRFASPRDVPAFVVGATTFGRRYLIVDAAAIRLLDVRRTILATWERDHVTVVVLEDCWGSTGVVIITDDDRCYELTVAAPVGDYVLAPLGLADRLGNTRTRKALDRALTHAGYSTTVSTGPAAT